MHCATFREVRLVTGIESVDVAVFAPSAFVSQNDAPRDVGRNGDVECDLAGRGLEAHTMAGLDAPRLRFAWIDEGVTVAQLLYNF